MKISTDRQLSNDGEPAKPGCSETSSGASLAAVGKKEGAVSGRCRARL
jgi:hypothetical protein